MKVDLKKSSVTSTFNKAVRLADFLPIEIFLYEALGIAGDSIVLVPFVFCRRLFRRPTGGGSPGPPANAVISLTRITHLAETRKLLLVYKIE